MVLDKGGVEFEPSGPNLMSFHWPPYQWLQLMPIVFFFLILQVMSSTLHIVHVICVT